jgi:hypothetical protein
MSIGLGPDVSQVDVVNKAAVAKTMAEDAQRLAVAPGYRRNFGWWPTGGAILRVALIAILVFVAIGWGLSALNH